MSKDNPTQYHTRTIDLFLKSYFDGLPSLDEAADVMFSANNLENHGYAIPAFVVDIEEYLISKARIHTYDGSIRDQSHMFSESGVKSKSLARRHPHKARQKFDFEMWAATAPQDTDSAEEAGDKIRRRRVLTQRFLGWQMQTIPRQGTDADEAKQPHPVHDINMFHEGRASSSGAPSMLQQFLTSLFLHETDGARNYEMLDFTMSDMGVHDRLSKPDSMGKWRNTANAASWRTQFNQCIEKYTKEYNKRFDEDPQDNYERNAIQHKLWELRGVPNSLVWNTLYDSDGIKRAEDRKQATKTLKNLTEDPQNEQFKGGFFAMYLGIPLLDYEDQLKVCEWFLDGAGNSGEGVMAHHFNDKVIDRIMGQNARGFLTRHAHGFANALRAIYTGNGSTSGHNSLVGGREAQNKERMAMTANKPLYHKLARLGKKNKDNDTRAILSGLPMTGENFDDILSTIPHNNNSTLSDVFGEIDINDLPNFEEKLNEEQFRGLMKKIANIHGEKSGKVQNREFYNNTKYLFKLKDDDFSPYGEDPKVGKTMLYFYTHALGGLEGAMGEDWSHWQDLLAEAFPQLFTDNTFFAEDEENTPEERVLPSSKREVNRGNRSGRLNPVRFQNAFQRNSDDNIITGGAKLRELKDALEAANMPEDDEYYIDKYLKGSQVEIDVPQEGTQEEYMREQLGDMSAEDYVGGYENPITGNTIGQSPIIGPMLMGSEYGNPAHDSANMRNDTNMKVENHISPMASIKAMRHQQLLLEKLGGKREAINTEGGTFSRDKRSRDSDNENVHSSVVDQNESKNRLLIARTLLFQNHHGIDNYNEDDHDAHNKKQEYADISRVTHRDPLGRGERAGGIYHNELISGEDTPDNLAIYDKDDFDKAHRSRVVELPTPLRDNIEDRHQLMFALTSPNNKGEVFHHNAANVSYGDLLWQERQAEKKNISHGNQGFYKNDDGEMKQYIVDSTPLHYYQRKMHALRGEMNQERIDGNTEQAELMERLAQEQSDLITDVLGEVPPITKNELRDNYLKDMRDQHQQSLAVSQFMRPLVMFANPELFQHHTPQLNNQAWADTKMFAHLCESFSRNLNPQQRENFLRNGEVVGMKKGGSRGNVSDILRDHFKSQGVSEKEAEELIYGKGSDSILSNITRPASRLTWTGDRNEGNSIKGFGDDGEQSIFAMIQKYVNGETDYPPTTTKQGRGNVDDSKVVKDIIDSVLKTLPKNPSTAQITKALHARYIPHGEEGTSKMGELPMGMIQRFGEIDESRIDVAKDPYNYDKLSGGHHHENMIDDTYSLMSGGEAVMTDKLKPRSMTNELRSLDRVFRQLYKHTKGTGNGIPGNINQVSLLNKKGDDWKSKLSQRMEKFISLLQQDAVALPPKRNAVNSMADTPTGGMDIDTVQHPAIETCRESNKKYGHAIRPSNSYRTPELSQGKLAVDSHNDADFHGSRREYTMAMDPYSLRDYNPNLNPYTIGADNKSQFPPVSIQESGVPGSNINANYAGIFGNAGTGVDLRLMDDDVFDHLTDDTLIFKADGNPVPIKSMHRIFDLGDLKHLRGFSGDWVASHIPQGEPIIVQKKGKKVKAHNADMKLVELTEEMHDEMGKVNDKDFVVHAVIDGENLYFIDLLEAADEKTHNMPANDRVRHLRAHFESSVHIKMPEPYNTKRADDEGLEEAVHLLREESSSDILLRDASTTYMRGEIRHPKWVLLSKEKKVDIIILDRKGMNYRIGVGPIMNPENYGARSVEMDGEHYMDVGSAKGPRGYDKGEYATVFCTGSTQSGEENPTYKIRSARIDRDAHPQAADSVETLSMMVSDSKIPHRVRLNKGSIHIIFPRLDDEVIYKVNEEEGGWMLEPQKTLWGNNEEYFMKLSEDMRPHWVPFATFLLKNKKKEGEVKPEAPAGHTKKRKEVLPEEEEIIKRGLEMAELMLDRVSKEKITSTGVEGLGINYAGADVESPRGPTTNMTDDTNLDFDPSARDYKEKPATTDKKSTRIRTTEGEEAVTDNRGNITITKPRV